MEEVVQEGGRRGEKVSGRGEAKKRGGRGTTKRPKVVKRREGSGMPCQENSERKVVIITSCEKTF